MRIIKIENCNSIENAEIKIVEGVLNIKYGPNGLGKSTIARSIISSVDNDGSLHSLKPFKYRGNPGEHEPSVEGVDDISNVLVFDDTYVSQFVFQRDEVLKNSFDIFIKNDEFLGAMQEIEELFSGIKSTFEDNEELESSICDLRDLHDAFGVTKKGKLSKSSKGYKAFGSGNKIENIPAELKPFEDFLKCEQPASWISWQAKGNAFLDFSDNCPYCASSIQEAGKKDIARNVSKEYDSKAVEHLNNLKLIIDRLGLYFEDSCRDALEAITKSKIELSPEEINFLVSLSGDVETLLSKLESLRTISFFSLRDVEKIEDEIEKLKIDLDLLEKLNSPETKKVIYPVNDRLQQLIGSVVDLKVKINKHKGQITKAIVRNQAGINDFLNSAGYKYSVKIQPEADSYKMKLVHHDFGEYIETASQHLSYGEKNAFALVLFMHQVLSEKPDLAILDDPVSSFDKTKKFAILNELFRGKASLRDSTVLLLTHDIEPAIDVIRSVKGLFQHSKPTACFLSSKIGVVSETEINECDIQTFAQICETNVRNLPDEVIKCIYLRRHFEILNDLGEEYNYLANLLHGRDIPINKTAADNVEMSSEEISIAKSGIERFVHGFDYNKILCILNDKEEMERRFFDSTIGYDKLQLFRVYRNIHIPKCRMEDILQKFVNETFHIENEYVMQLNPHKFDNVPEYVVSECERMLVDG